MTCQSEIEDELARLHDTYKIPGEATASRKGEEPPEFPGAAHVAPIERVELFEEGEDPYPDQETKMDLTDTPLIRMHFAHPDAQFRNCTPSAGIYTFLYAGVTDPKELEGVYVPLRWKVTYPDHPDDWRDFDPLDPENEDKWYLGLANRLIEQHVKGGEDFPRKDN